VSTRPSFSEWFCLRENRSNYTVDPERDHAFLFGRQEWQEKIRRDLRNSQLLHVPVRLVWWGQYGIGKTHRIKYTQHLIESEDLAFLPVYVVCRDIGEKSGFEVLHFDLVNNLGQENVRRWLHDYLLEIAKGDRERLPLDKICYVQDVVNAFYNLGGQNTQLWAPAWSFLAGRKLSANETALAGVTKNQIDSSLEFASVLKVLATVIQAQEGRQLLYLLDQVEALTKITNRSQEARWVETLRTVLDVQELGLILAVGADRQDGIPTIVLEPEIVRRFQQDNYRPIPAFEEVETKEFLHGLLREWTDPQARDAVAAAEGWQENPDLDYDPETYPFTRSAFEMFCGYCTADPREAIPSLILDRLNRVGADAYLEGKRLLTRDFLVSHGISA